MYRVNDFDRMALERAQRELKAVGHEARILAHTYEDDLESLKLRRETAQREAYETLRRAADCAEAFLASHDWESEDEKVAYDRWADFLHHTAMLAYTGELDDISDLTRRDLLDFHTDTDTDNVQG